MGKCSGSTAAAAWGWLTAGSSAEAGLVAADVLLHSGGWRRGDLWMRVTW